MLKIFVFLFIQMNTLWFIIYEECLTIRCLFLDDWMFKRSLYIDSDLI